MRSVWRFTQWSISSFYERLTNESWLRKLMGRRSLISGSTDWRSNDVYLDIRHCDWRLRSYVEDILQLISLGWKKSEFFGISGLTWKMFLVWWAGNTNNEARLHDMTELPTNLGCEDHLWEEACYLAHQTSVTVMCILIYITVTDVYVVT